jgi:hypothetical protein
LCDIGVISGFFEISSSASLREGSCLFCTKFFWFALHLAGLWNAAKRIYLAQSRLDVEKDFM